MSGLHNQGMTLVLATQSVSYHVGLAGVIVDLKIVILNQL
jgi:hypothetical protein